MGGRSSSDRPVTPPPGDGGPSSTRPRQRLRLRSPLDIQRSDFLRRCRRRLAPEDVGLPREARARGGGLRREDVAALAGVSASWYTWLEQGRDIRVSDTVLDRVSQALRLSEDERTFLYSLMQHRPPRLDRATCMEVPEDVLRMINALPHPAVVMNLRCDILAWNAANNALYLDYGTLPPEQRNLLEMVLLLPNQQTPEQVENAARRLIGRLRFDYSLCAGDPQFEALMRKLLSRSPLFARLWRVPDVALNAFGLQVVQHARFGTLAFEHTSYVPDGHPYIRVVVCTPADEATRQAMATVHAEQEGAGGDAG